MSDAKLPATTNHGIPSIIDDPVEKRRDAPLGIHFDMPEDDYHSDVALGSSDMRRLSYSPPDFWWDSKWNPLWKPDDDTKAKIYGRAVHTIILEGREKFNKLYAPKQYSWATKEGKAEKAAMEALGKLPLEAEDWERALLTGQIVRSNPNLKTAFDGSVGNEVSIFWERKGIKRKARIDSFKVRASVDLKNISNDRAISFPKACLRKIDDYSYHIQAEHYREARLAARALFEQGFVFGECDRALLKQVVESDQFAWVFIFVQSSGAPLTWSTKLSYKAERTWTDDDGEVQVSPEEINPIYELGRGQIERAEKNWKRYTERFGLTTPWVLNEPINELDVSEFPPWFARGSETEGS